MATVDLTVVGHVTRDIVVHGNRRRTQPGGTAYYSSLAAASLGSRVAVVTSLSTKDSPLLFDLRRAGVDVHVKPSLRTTTFANVYADADKERSQRILSSADRIETAHISGISSRVWYFGPLAPNDISVGCLRHASDHGALVVLDAQGLLRQVGARGEVSLTSNPALAEWVARVDVLKVTESEAIAATGALTLKEAMVEVAAMRPCEIVATRGDSGSLILHAGKFISVSAYHTPRVEDTTGCGDTYLSAYIWCRLQDWEPEDAGRLAAAAAAHKAMHSGYLEADRDELLRFARNTQIGPTQAG